MIHTKRMEAFQTSIFTNIKKMKEEYIQRTGNTVIDFSIGSPNIAPVSCIIETMKEKMDEPDNWKYAITDMDEMKQAIQTWYKERYQVDLAYDEMICVSGSQQALSILPMSICDPGDIVLVQDPYYPIFSDGPKIAGATIHYMPLLEENNYLIQFNQIDPEIARQAKLMIVSYPNNPTCAIAPDSFYEELIQFAKKNNILVLHDNAYSELVFDGKVGKSFLSFEGAKDIGVELNSFSKTFGMAGARLGVCVGNKDIIESFEMLKSNMDYGIFKPIQYAAITALKEGKESIAQTCLAYQNRRDALVKAFKEAGWNISKTPATMFMWAKIPDSYSDSMAFTKELLEKAGVVVTPGMAFGEQGKRYVRIALVQDEKEIMEAANRIQKANLF
ncbi:aminotransferase class I/II-fold pyridoxal phosphate-dependent enzyme [Floccifex sp.]|uniref:aminotransferase class I/II-fold pyridoxal phosphate-dependent enzyme n=1 Tax=Floccifex sp. TaxID=2815810 RepID=UPI003F0A07F5